MSATKTTIGGLGVISAGIGGIVGCGIILLFFGTPLVVIFIAFL